VSGDARHPREPLAALWTPRGRSAIATVRVSADLGGWSGLSALPFRSADGRPLGEQPYGRIVFGWWGRDAREEVVLSLLDERTLEIHCHGGDAAAERVLRNLEEAGCRVLTWQQLCRLAEGELQTELREQLARARTARTAAILLEQSGGLLRLESVGLLAADWNGADAAARLKEILRWNRFGLHLAQPWRVVLAGRPNAGKSSLANALLGYPRSIVFDEPGTTRDVVTGPTALDGWPVEIADTAGIRDSLDPLESAGVSRARGALADSDLAVVLIDVSVPRHVDDERLLAACPDALVVAHKSDLPADESLHRWTAERRRSWLPVSAKTGAGVESLAAAIVARLVPEVPPAETPLAVTPRQARLLQAAYEAAGRDDQAACRAALEDLLA
jgi:tRNA modification GTPase